MPSYRTRQTLIIRSAVLSILLLVGCFWLLSETAFAQEKTCPVNLYYPSDINPGSVKRDFGLLDLEQQKDGSATVASDYQFNQGRRQTVPDTMSYSAFKKNHGPFPPHPVLATLRNNPDSAFIAVGETTSYRVTNLHLTEPYVDYFGEVFVRDLKGEISAETYAGGRQAFGFIGDKDRLPEVIQVRPVRLDQPECLKDQLKTVIENRFDTGANFEKALRLGEFRSFKRLLIKYDFPDSDGSVYDKNSNWYGIVDITDHQASVRYVVKKENRFGAEALLASLTLLIAADRNHDGLADLVFLDGMFDTSYEPWSGQVILVNGSLRTQSFVTRVD